MDWFEAITGFRESAAAVRKHLSVVNGRLASAANGRSFAIGHLALPSLGELRREAGPPPSSPARLALRNMRGDVRALHRDPAMAGALFQVASQFNILEMVGPEVTPEDGVTCYAYDRTQGPACAIAAGAATIFRNWFAPVDGGIGQTRDRQIDTLAPLGKMLSQHLAIPVGSLWSMRNGYALCTGQGLEAIGKHLQAAGEEERDSLRGALQIGLHREITDGGSGQIVSQAFCSALPVAYGGSRHHLWEPFARLVLEAAYQATLYAAVVNARRTGRRTVVLTLLGGGAFGNSEGWIEDAMRRSLSLMRGYALDVRILNYGTPPNFALQLEQEFK